MADNDREYIILDKDSLLCRCRGAEYTGCGGTDGCKVCFNFKTRAEYEDMILETINKECSSVLDEIKSVNTKDLAKAVVDRLLGEGL